MKKFLSHSVVMLKIHPPSKIFRKINLLFSKKVTLTKCFQKIVSHQKKIFRQINTLVISLVNRCFHQMIWQEKP